MHIEKNVFDNVTDGRPAAVPTTGSEFLNFQNREYRCRGIQTRRIMAQDSGRGRGSSRGRGRPRNNTGIFLDLRTTPATTMTMATTSTPSVSASQGLPPIPMIPTPEVRVHSM
ncbi:hypothetical protein PIB30_073896 [Stylosanthes scabra]|uniref:Uncharacterized protein n=1 Tax=Stylosanthes scabra TaxID=79078 RepID=A0ABU6QQP7_9FABA|nr:hypothetical protein [Stylosanthes scabra]